jgi:hypothetical protein
VKLYYLKHRGTTFPIPVTASVVGRSAAHADIVLPGERVSRKHAQIRVVDDRPVLEDMGSRNGTYVNGRKITRPTPLKPGDIVTIGEEVLEIAAREAPDVELWSKLDDDEEDVATVTERNAVGLVEELVSRTVGIGERAAVAGSLREMIDAIADAAEMTGRRLGPREATRLAAASRVVAGWVPDRSLDRWAQELSDRLERLSEPPA